MTDLMDAIRERRARAIEVAATYFIEAVGLQCWVVKHPTDDDRCYFVDMAARRCNCPDFMCCAQAMEIDCKHILAVDPIWRRECDQPKAAFVYRGRLTNDSGVLAVVQDADPFQTLPR